MTTRNKREVGTNSMLRAMERGPIRPPSESASLLIRLSRNCPWGRCAFCHSYLGRRFSSRQQSEILNDISVARDIATQIQELLERQAGGGRITRALVDEVCAQGLFSTDSVNGVASWLHQGGETVFLQDADALAMSGVRLLEILAAIKEAFPAVRRITSYCRSRTAAAKSPDELLRLSAAGLSRVHIGLESGCDEVLAFMNKGVTAAQQVAGGRAIKDAGISLCVYVMPGLGGRRWSEAHAADTARVINRIDPDYVRLRTLHVAPGSSLRDLQENGLFEPLGEEEIVGEIRRFITGLEGIGSTLVSDHILNLLEELRGKFPEDKERLLGIIDRFFSLSPEERLVFRIGRRKGIYRSLDDLADRQLFQWLNTIVAQYEMAEPGQLDRDLDRVKDSFI